MKGNKFKLLLAIMLAVTFIIYPSGQAYAYSYVYPTTNLNVRYGPSLKHKKLEIVNPSTRLIKISESNGWTKIYYKGAMYYVSSSYLRTSLNSTNLNNTSPNVSTNKNIEDVISYGYKFIGCGYSQQNRWGPYTYDCSSFLNKIFKDTTGINIGSWTGAIKNKYDNTYHEVSLYNRKRGDILWGRAGNNNHVALYLGNNKILHCSGSRGVAITSMNYSSALKWTNCYRILT